MLYKNVGKVTADRIWKFLSANSDPLSAVASDNFMKCASKTAAPSLRKFRIMIGNIVDSPSKDSSSEMIDIILESGYREYLQKKYSDMESREEDLNQLGNFSKKFSAMEDFLSELALMTNIEAEEERTYYQDRDERGLF